MTHTVIGFFRNSSDANSAADRLRERGFETGNVDISGNVQGDKEEGGHEGRSGKIGNFFRSLFSDDEKNADSYSRAAHDNYLVTVHASGMEEAERASDILDSCGAINVDEKYGNQEDYSGSDRYTNTDLSDLDETDLHEQDLDTKRPFSFKNDDDLDNINEASIPVVEEEVNIGKQEVKRGGVRVRSRIIEKPIEETLRLREEHVNVERVPVDRDASEIDLDNFKDETVEVHEYREEPLVSKRSRVVEEVRVGKEVHEREETVREKARKKEVDVENIEDEEKLRSSNKR